LEKGAGASRNQKEKEAIKYILMMSGKKAGFGWFAKWSKQDLPAHFAFMQSFNKHECVTLLEIEGPAPPRGAGIAFTISPCLP
jgi:hypothetical protein